MLTAKLCGSWANNRAPSMRSGCRFPPILSSLSDSVSNRKVVAASVKDFEFFTPRSSFTILDDANVSNIHNIQYLMMMALVNDAKLPLLVTEKQDQQYVNNSSKEFL